MKEDFLSFIWKNRLYYLPLRTTDGESLHVLNPGVVNGDSGPDFFNSVIRHGKTIWAGNVELHLKSSDWYKHGHHTDEAYESVILHVVHYKDCDIKNRTGSIIPTLELKGNFDPVLYDSYRKLSSHKGYIACEKLIDDISLEIFKVQLSRCFSEKINRKKGIIRSFYSFYKNDLEATFYTFLFRNFGFRANGLPFELLAKSFDFKLLYKYNDQPPMIEALLFGQSGLLPKQSRNSYTRELVANYGFLKRKHGLNPVDASIWRFMRMRPNGFPTIRIAQLASLICNTPDLYYQCSGILKPESFIKLFSVFPSEFWNDHYSFSRKSPLQVKGIGRDSTGLLYMNFHVPFLSFIEDISGGNSFPGDLTEMTGGFHPDQNHITREFSKIGINTENAIGSNGLTELKLRYCDRKRCLECLVGQNIISRKL